MTQKNLFLPSEFWFKAITAGAKGFTFRLYRNGTRLIKDITPHKDYHDGSIDAVLLIKIYFKSFRTACGICLFG